MTQIQQTPELQTSEQAKAQGYTVDHHCSPWVAYKGPRFNPTEWLFLRSDTEIELEEIEAERDRLRAERDALLAVLKAARIEIDESADKMFVLGFNHPGGLWPGGQLDQDKAFMGELAERFRNASKAADAAIAKAEDRS